MDEQIEAGVRRHCKTLRPFANDLLLLEPGLDSRCISALVANAKTNLGLIRSVMTWKFR